MSSHPGPAPTATPKYELATFGGGCFWCTEAVFLQMNGVEQVVSGYAGGHVADPTYQQVCTGTTGHAEVIQITFDPKVISYGKLLEIFFRTHDPTTLNRQGNDAGTQYRSVIFPHNEQQHAQAEEMIARWNASGLWPDPIVTTIESATAFYPAEDYHRNYFALHGREPYCQLVIQPKIEKARKVFSNELKLAAES